MNNWGFLVVIGIAAVSWILGKVREHAEAQKQQERLRLRRPHEAQQSHGSPEGRKIEVRLEPAPGQPRTATLGDALGQRHADLQRMRREQLEKMRRAMARVQGAPPQPAPAPSPRAPSGGARPAGAPRPARPSRPQQARPSGPKPPAGAPRQRKPSALEPVAGAGHSPDLEHEEVHRLVQDTERAPAPLSAGTGSLGAGMTSAHWRRAVVLAEALRPPLSLRGGEEH